MHQGGRLSSKMPVGVDIIEPPMLFELEKAGLKIADGQQTMLEAREIKSIDEIALLNRAAAMVDGAYHLVHEELKPGVRENDIVADGQRVPLPPRLRRRGGDQRHLRRALQPAPAQLHRPHAAPRRPGVLRHPAVVHGLPHLLLPHLQRRPRHARAARRLQEGARVARQGDRADQAGRLHRQGVQRVAQGGGVRLPRRDVAPSACSSATASAAPSTSGRSSPASSRSIIPPRSRRAWCSRSRPTARPRTASPPPASRRRSSSPTRAAASSRCSRPRSCRSRTGIDRVRIRAALPKVARFSRQRAAEMRANAVHGHYHPVSCNTWCGHIKSSLTTKPFAAPRPSFRSYGATPRAIPRPFLESSHKQKAGLHRGPHELELYPCHHRKFRCC